MPASAAACRCVVPFVGRVQNFGCTATRGIDGGGVKQPVAALEERRPTVGIQDVAFHQFQAFLVAKRCSVGEDMVRFVGVVEVANRTFFTR